MLRLLGVRISVAAASGLTMMLLSGCGGGSNDAAQPQAPSIPENPPPPQPTPPAPPAPSVAKWRAPMGVWVGVESMDDGDPYASERALFSIAPYVPDSAIVLIVADDGTFAAIREDDTTYRGEFFDPSTWSPNTKKTTATFYGSVKHLGNRMMWDDYQSGSGTIYGMEITGHAMTAQGSHFNNRIDKGFTSRLVLSDESALAIQASLTAIAGTYTIDHYDGSVLTIDSKGEVFSQLGTAVIRGSMSIQNPNINVYDVDLIFDGDLRNAFFNEYPVPGLAYFDARTREVVMILDDSAGTSSIHYRLKPTN